MKDEKKILFVSGSLNRGGAQRVITLLANDYAQRGWSVHIIVMMNAEVGYELNPAMSERRTPRCYRVLCRTHQYDNDAGGKRTEYSSAGFRAE